MSMIPRPVPPPRTTTEGPAPADIRVGAVVLTLGDRPTELTALLDSVANQYGPPIEVVLVVNGGKTPADLPDFVRVIELDSNVGIPAGRNVGAEALDCDVVMFLDDDGLIRDPGIANRLRSAFAHNPDLGIVTFRIVDPVTKTTQRRHVPRLGSGAPLRSGAVTTFLGGACAIRAEVLREVGGLPDEFFYAHEETDLAWRALDAGWSVDYRADVVLEHPATSPARHPHYHRMNARNRVWLARRNLPWPIVPAYLASWVVITAARRPDREGIQAWTLGFREGWNESCGPRNPISWRTVWHMTRLRRPPLI